SRIEELLAIEGPDLESLSENAADAPIRDYADVIDAESVTVVSARATGPAADVATASPADVPAAAEPLKPVAATPEPPPIKAEPQPRVMPPLQTSQKPDAKIFVAPRAPDDPGLDEAEPDNVSPLPRRPYRAVN
nr:heme biosynthesis protein HemY [Hyphomicrobium sp.]